MASQQPNAWANRNRQSNPNSASRTPTNRSGTASPSQQNPSQPPRQEPARAPAQNAWTQRNSGAGPSNGQSSQPSRTDAEQSVNGFNAAQVKAFLGRDAGVEVYKPAEGPGSTRASGGAWGAKPNHMANNQPFFTQLAKQVATLEGGG